MLAERHSAVEGPQQQQAKDALAGLNDWLDTQIEKHHQAFENDPVGSFEALQNLSRSLKGSQRHDALRTAVDDYKKNPILKAELPAHKLFLRLRNTVHKVSAQPKALTSLTRQYSVNMRRNSLRLLNYGNRCSVSTPHQQAQKRPML